MVLSKRMIFGEGEAAYICMGELYKHAHGLTIDLPPPPPPPKMLLSSLVRQVNVVWIIVQH